MENSKMSDSRLFHSIKGSWGAVLMALVAFTGATAAFVTGAIGQLGIISQLGPYQLTLDFAVAWTTFIIPTAFLIGVPLRVGQVLREKEDNLVFRIAGWGLSGLSLFIGFFLVVGFVGLVASFILIGWLVVVSLALSFDLRLKEVRFKLFAGELNSRLLVLLPAITLALYVIGTFWIEQLKVARPVTLQHSEGETVGALIAGLNGGVILFNKDEAKLQFYSGNHVKSVETGLSRDVSIWGRPKPD